MMPPITYIDEPNMIIPLAVSYNTRGIAGFTQSVTNARDQRKMNCIYEPVENTASGKVTLYLAKRPGWQQAGNTYGISSQTAYLSELAPGATEDSTAWRWVISKLGDDTRVSNSTSTVTVTTSITLHPAYVDKTQISGVDTLVLQLQASGAGGAQRTFYTSSLSLFTEMSSGVLNGLTRTGKMEFLNGYAFQSTLDSVYNSALNSLDVWSADGFIRRRITQDIGTGLGRLGALIISFGTASMEVFGNAGKPIGSPLESLPHLAKDHGMRAPTLTRQRHYYAVRDGWLYWRGTNPDGMYAFNGERVEKVSNFAVDKILRQNDTSVTFVSAIGFHGKRGIVVGLSDIGAAVTTQRALVYFPAWKDWFEWRSNVFVPQSGQRMESIFIGIGENANKLFTPATSDVWRDGGTDDITMTVQFKLPNAGNAHRRLQMLGVKGDTAASNTTSVLNVRFTFDDWQTSTSAGTIDMTKARKRITRCGGYSDLGVYLDHTGNLDCRLEAVVARVE